MQVHDDLAALFSRNLTLQSIDLAALQQQQAREEELRKQNAIVAETAPAPAQEAPARPIVYSISQHYNHSAHIARQPSQVQEQTQQQTGAQIQRPASEPPAETTESILASHGVDPSALSPAQIQLFREAADAQKQRLVELWRICPPQKEQMGDASGLTWSSTTMEREEVLAEMRYEEMLQRQLIEEHQQQMQQQQQASGTVMSLDGTAVQREDSRWLPCEHVEPYMMTGYEYMMRQAEETAQREREQQAAYKLATDPVYNNAGPISDWQIQQYQMQLENQYGIFEYSRGQAGTADAMEIL
jgi:hypothetical protein